MGLGSGVFVGSGVGENSSVLVGLAVFVGLRVAAGTSFNSSRVGERASPAQALKNSARKMIAVNHRSQNVFSPGRGS